MIGTGSVCATSAISAPRVTTISTPSISAASAIPSANVRQRRFGSVPASRTRSRSAPGGSRGEQHVARATRSPGSGPRSGGSSAGWPGSRRTPQDRSARSPQRRGTRRRSSVRSWPSPPRRSSPRKHKREPGIEAAEARPPRRARPWNETSGSGVAGTPVRASGVRVEFGNSERWRPQPPAPQIAELRPGQRFRGIYACVRKDRLSARNGSIYLSLELRDRTGSIPARVFREVDRLAGRFERGDAIQVSGKVERFRGELVAEVDDIQPVADGELDPVRFPAGRVPGCRRSWRGSSST